jgi:putative ABC transport system permease protein
MMLIAWRSIVCHKLRSILLALCVVIGVAFVAGTFVFTDTIKNVYTKVFDQAYKGLDVSVRTRSELSGMTVHNPIPADVLGTVRAVPGVRVAEGDVFTLGGRIFDAANKPVGNQFAPTFLGSWPTDSALNSFALASGALPQAPDEVVIDQEAVTAGKFKVGDNIRIQTARGTNSFRLAGVAKFGTANNMGGASAVLFTLAGAQAEANRVGLFDDIAIAADKGVDAAALQDRVQSALGPKYEALTGAQLSSETSGTINDQLSFLNTFLLAFAGISLLVGATIVYNTFAIVVAQRTKEMALLRSLGADGSQVIGSIMSESVVIGLAASTLGLLAGIGLAIGLKSLLGLVGFALPAGNLVILSRTIIVSVIGGMVVTVASAIAPAMRAARVPPLAAVRSVSTTTPKQRRSFLIAGVVLSVTGIAATVSGAQSTNLARLGIGALCALSGISLLGPSIVAPFVHVLAAPVRRLRGVSGQLAEENATRSSRRTANTAASLMIGTAVIAASLLLASSITTSTTKILDEGMRADLIVSTGGISVFGPEASAALRKTAGVASVAPYRYGAFQIGDATKRLSAMDGAALDMSDSNAALDLDLVEGSLRAIDDGGVAITEGVAKSNGWKVGDTIPAAFATGPHPLVVKAIFRSKVWGDYMVSLKTHELVYPDSSDTLAFIHVADGTSVVDAKHNITTVLTTIAPAAKVQDRKEYAGVIQAQITQILSLITALVLLAIIIALLGVLITMLLSVFERTRELGLLRAIGMDRRSVRSMVRWEAAIISTFGAVLGVVLGVGLGYALTRAMRDQGISTIEIPYKSLIIMILLITLAGVGASLYPARRAARLNVLNAIATD